MPINKELIPCAFEFSSLMCSLSFNEATFSAFGNALFGNYTVRCNNSFTCMMYAGHSCYEAENILTIIIFGMTL